MRGFFITITIRELTDTVKIPLVNGPMYERGGAFIENVLMDGREERAGKYGFCFLQIRRDFPTFYLKIWSFNIFL